MTLYYTTNPIAFYDTDIGPAPDDAVEISAEDRNKLMQAQANGKQIVGNNGKLVAADAPVQETALITNISPLEFFSRFTDDEMHTIAAAALQSPALFVWYTRAGAAQYIDLENDLTKAGLAALVEAGLLTQERSMEILAVT